MANFPIMRTKMTMPGTSGGIRPNLDYETGEANVWRAVGNLAEAGTETVSRIYLLQAEQQYVDAKLKAETEMINLAKYLNENTDEYTYQGEFEKSVGNIKKNAPRNPLAARRYDYFVRQQVPLLQNSVDESSRRRIVDKWGAQRILAQDKWEATGNSAEYLELTQAGVALGYMDKEAATKEILATENAANYNQAIEVARVRPQEIIDSFYIKDGKERIGILPNITDIGQIMAIENIAVNKLRENNNAKQKNEIDAYLAIRRGQLNDPTKLDTMLENGQITLDAHKSLVKMIGAGSSDSTDLKSLASINEAILTYQTDPTFENRQKALETLYANSPKLTPSDNESKLNEIYSEVNKMDIAEKREAYSTMANLLGGSSSGDPLNLDYLFGNPSEKDAWILSKMLWDDEIKRAAKAGKPLDATQKRYAAIRIARQVKREMEGKTAEEILPLPSEGKKKGKRTTWKFGLDKIWDDLSPESRKSAVNLLDKGYTPEQLIAYYESKK